MPRVFLSSLYVVLSFLTLYSWFIDNLRIHFMDHFVSGIDPSEENPYRHWKMGTRTRTTRTRNLLAVTHSSHMEHQHKWVELLCGQIIITDSLRDVIMPNELWGWTSVWNGERLVGVQTPLWWSTGKSFWNTRVLPKVFGRLFGWRTVIKQNSIPTVNGHDLVWRFWRCRCSSCAHCNPGGHSEHVYIYMKSEWRMWGGWITVSVSRWMSEQRKYTEHLSAPSVNLTGAFTNIYRTKRMWTSAHTFNSSVRSLGWNGTSTVFQITPYSLCNGRQNLTELDTD